MRVAWDLPELRPNGPDITVFFGVQRQQNWTTFDCAEEGVRPVLVVEVTSPETRHQDLVDKLEIYEAAGVRQYLIVDTRRFKGQEQLVLSCYRQDINGFPQCLPNDQKQLWLEELELWVGVEEQHVVCSMPDGQIMHSYTETRAQARQARIQVQHAEALAREEASARAAAEVRVRELEAELAGLRG